MDEEWSGRDRRVQVVACKPASLAGNPRPQRDWDNRISVNIMLRLSHRVPAFLNTKKSGLRGFKYA